jgi:FkbM family methyltransferase
MVRSALTDLRALLRSLRIYRFDDRHTRTLREFYQPMIRPGSLVFDIGAHAGDRTACFRQLGARVISIEPQPLFAAFLRASHALHRSVTVRRCVVSDAAGVRTFWVNSRNPTVSTVSESFVEAASSGKDVGWQGQVWDRSTEVAATTLDQLIAEYGRPDFVKIDVEGAELDVLRGLTQPLPMLSFEFTILQRELASDCLARCAALGFQRFNLSLGESHAFEFADPVDAPTLQRLIAGLSPDANSGDVYAFGS